MNPAVRLLATLTWVAVSLFVATVARAATWIDIAAAREAVVRDGAVVIDARSVKDYAEGHVEGARSAPWQSLSAMVGKPGDARWGTVLPAEKLAAALGALGLQPDSRVVVYSSSPKGWGEDGRVAWTLRAAGLKRVQILDGGFEAWRAAGGAVSREAPKVTPTTFPLAKVDLSLDATKDEVKAALGRAKIVDARAPEEYRGAQKFGEPRGGHLPGAVNLPWDQVFDDTGRLRAADALRRQLKDAGIGPDDEVIAYCTKGIRSAHLALVLRELGYGRARNYDASFYEWAGDPTLPIEK